MSKKKKYNVFISHHGKDDDKVQGLKKRLIDKGYSIRNYSVDSTKHKDGRRPSDAVIQRYLRRQITWAGTFICLIGKETHTRKWVNYEIRKAHLQGKKIVGIYTHGNNNSVELPEAFKKYGGPTIGWNSLDKLGDIMDGKDFPNENPDGTSRTPIYKRKKVKCSK
ncbi:TIR domain-containing protein [Flagellimonas sp. HMM57]|uniref:TIR domain-containing protein n=1 Tax=unclassified Flagellimonas TaxID=2644544 RepID=UPI0013D28B6D|nr:MULTISPECIES: TIR domain-containing protein [unclassified Flagellimonas]UII77182.1 TIR domain-containing protein [Flagellimonas sp. HMM57]